MQSIWNPKLRIWSRAECAECLLEIGLKWMQTVNIFPCMYEYWVLQMSLCAWGTAKKAGYMARFSFMNHILKSQRTFATSRLPSHSEKPLDNLSCAVLRANAAWTKIGAQEWKPTPYSLDLSAWGGVGPQCNYIYHIASLYAGDKWLDKCYRAYTIYIPRFHCMVFAVHPYSASSKSHKCLCLSTWHYNPPLLPTQTVPTKGRQALHDFTCPHLTS